MKGTIANSTLSRRTPMKKGGKLASVGKRGKRRQARYRAFLKSQEWRDIRAATLVNLDYTCTCGCGWRDDTETGKDLDCHHVNGYKKPLGQEIPGVDTTLLRRRCHRRAHWWKAAS